MLLLCVGIIPLFVCEFCFLLGFSLFCSSLHLFVHSFLRVHSFILLLLVCLCGCSSACLFICLFLCLCSAAIKAYEDKLTTFELSEILDYSEIWFLGLEAKKIEGVPGAPQNSGMVSFRQLFCGLYRIQYTVYGVQIVSRSFNANVLINEFLSNSFWRKLSCSLWSALGHVSPFQLTQLMHGIYRNLPEKTCALQWPFELAQSSGNSRTRHYGNSTQACPSGEWLLKSACLAGNSTSPGLSDTTLTLSLPRVINFSFPCILTRSITSHSMNKLVFITYSYERWLYYQFSLSRLYILKGWENVRFWSWEWKS